VHVPLLVRMPEAGARRVPQPVSLIDILPTLLSGLDLPAPAGLEGRNLGPLLRGAPVPDAPVFSVTAYLNQMTAVRQGNWKLVYTPSPPQPVAGDPWSGFYSTHEGFALFDIDADPGETRNLYATDPAHGGRLWAVLTSWQRAHQIPIGRRTLPTPDEATRQRMEALGYGAP
jgi:arylsulfatase A-like enzyme